MTQSLLVIIKGQPRYVTYVLNVCSIQNFLNMREREREREREMKNTYCGGVKLGPMMWAQEQRFINNTPEEKKS